MRNQRPSFGNKGESEREEVTGVLTGVLSYIMYSSVLLEGRGRMQSGERHTVWTMYATGAMIRMLWSRTMTLCRRNKTALQISSLAEQIKTKSAFVEKLLHVLSQVLCKASANPKNPSVQTGKKKKKIRTVSSLND